MDGVEECESIVRTTIVRTAKCKEANKKPRARHGECCIAVTSRLL
jgi:hypothetical protein